MSKKPHYPTFGQIKKGVQYAERPGAYALIANPHDEVAIVETSFGFFLPGGGMDPGESQEEALRRELFEEIGYSVTSMEFLTQASQYHWSEFYKSYFKKIGYFYEVTAVAPPRLRNQDGHNLTWMAPETAAVRLSQEFQRFAMDAYRLSP